MKEKRIYNVEDYQKNKREIIKLKEKYLEEKTKAENIVATYSADPKPMNRNQDGSGLEKYVVHMLEITDRINELEMINLEILLRVRRLPYKEKIVIENLYIKNISLKEQTYILNKSYRYLQKIKADGLRKYSENLQFCTE